MGCANSTNLTPPGPLRKPILVQPELKGEWDPVDKIVFEAVKAGHAAMPKLTEETIPAFREMMHANYKVQPPQQAFIDACDVDEFKIDATPYGAKTKELRILYVKPKNKSYDNSKALMYFHGGAMITFNADLTLNCASKMALDGDMPVFSVDFTSAPENKAPESIIECYAATKYVSENAAKWNVDKSRIAIHGESSGGYLTAGVAYHLATKNEGHLVKVAMVDIGMVSSKPWAEMEEKDLYEAAAWVKEGHTDTTLAVMCPGGNWKQAAKDKDPYMFPAEMPDAMMKKCPPFVITTREFDMYRHDCEHLAERAKANGKLLEFYIHPGTCHFTVYEPMHENFKKLYSHYI